MKCDEFVSGLVKNIKSAHNCARKSLKTSLKRIKRNYDLRVLLRPNAEGDINYLLDMASVQGKSRNVSSLERSSSDCENLSTYLYRVKLRNAVFCVNHDRMMPCNDMKVPEWITKYKKSKTEMVDRDEEDDLEEYCICKKLCSGRFMIQCDYCDE